MSELGRKVEAMLTGGQVPPSSLRDQMREVERSAGSGRKAAASLGIPESTWRRWKSGAQPKGGRAAAVGQAVRQRAMAGRTSDAGVVLNVKQGSRSRTLKANSLNLKQGTMAAAAAAYAKTGDREAAAAVFVKGVDKGDSRGFYAKSLKKGMGADWPEYEEEYEYLATDIDDDTLPGMA